MIIQRCIAAAVSCLAGTAMADTFPVADTDDAALNAVDAGAGARRLHLRVSAELANGDYSRGGYDDDASNLRRLPVHLGVSASAELQPGLFLIGTASNGLHAPASSEQGHPRAWYESNTIAGVAWRPRDGMTAAALYTVKTSPNDVSRTQHEASLSFGWSGASLRPTAVATVRARGGHGGYLQLGIAPEWTLGDGADAPKVDLPVKLGVGFDGFYGSGSGTVPWTGAGVGFSQPLRIAGERFRLRAEAQALVRSGTLRRLDGDFGNRATVVPLVALTLAWLY